jgi:hypothetical protein
MNKQEKKILFWSPMLSHVGTLKATIEMAKSFNKYEDCRVYILNIFGSKRYLALIIVKFYNNIITLNLFMNIY